MRPFHVVEGQGFKRLMKEILPNFKVPSSSYIKTKLSEKYEVCANVEKDKMKNVLEFCLTTDIWTETMSEKSFLGVTIHYIDGIKLAACNIAVRELKSNHTAQYIVEILREILTDWNIELTKIRTIVTDNGTNMVAAAKSLVGEKNQLPCFAHTINLVVEIALENDHAKAIINKVREIVKWVKNSVINSDKLRLIQIKKGIPEGSIKKFILDVKTRWNSVYYMIERFIEMQNVCSELLNENSRGPEMLCRSEMDTLKQLVSLLKPFEYVTREASAENYITISKIIPMVSCLIKQLHNLSTTDTMKEVQQNLQKELNRRFRLTEMNTHIAIATLLDPRFKNIHFRDPNACSRAIQKLKDIIKSDIPATSSESDEENSVLYDFWQHHKELVHTKKKKKCNQEGDELSLYLSGPVCNLKSNPLEEWEDMKYVFPLLYKQARLFLVVVASSVPCERLFSKAGAIICKTRNRLSSKHLEKLIFLNGLSEKDFFG